MPGKHALADIICYCKMTSVMALVPFRLERVKTLQIHVNVCDRIQLLAGFPQCNGRKLEEAEDFKCIFVVCCVLESK